MLDLEFGRHVRGRSAPVRENHCVSFAMASIYGASVLQ